MKKIIFIVSCISITGTFIISCEKENTTLSTTPKNVKSNNLDKAISPGEGGFIDLSDIGGGPISARVHRGTTNRKRDGKNCGCNECFGICGDLTLDGSLLDVILNHLPINAGGGNSGNNSSGNSPIFEDPIEFNEGDNSPNFYVAKIDDKKAELFVLKNYSHFDSEFGVDNIVEGKKAKGLINRAGNANAIKLFPGEYSAIQETGIIKINQNEYLPYYARVMVNASFLRK